jgi:hypothetical protein
VKESEKRGGKRACREDSGGQSIPRGACRCFPVVKFVNYHVIVRRRSQGEPRRNCYAGINELADDMELAMYAETVGIPRARLRIEFRGDDEWCTIDRFIAPGKFCHSSSSIPRSASSRSS